MEKYSGRHQKPQPKYSGRHQKPQPKDKKKEQSVAKRDKRKVRDAKKTDKRFALIIVAIVLLLMAAIVGAALFINGKLNKLNYDDGTLANPFTGELTEEDYINVDISGLEIVEDLDSIPDLDIIQENGVINILLLGTDERSFEFSDSARSDAIMLLSLNTDDYTAKLVSIERGLGVPIIEGVHEGENDLITHCFRWGGADLVMKEVQACLRVEVNRYVRVNLNSFIKVIDVLGGVDVELSEEEAWYINLVSNGKPIPPVYTAQGYYRGETSDLEGTQLEEGINHLNGTEALALARLRGIDSDWHRIERQRRIVQSCSDQLKNTNLKTLNTLLNEILPMVKTNFTKEELVVLMMKAPGFLGVEFEQMTIPVEGTYGGATGLSGDTMYAPIFEENAKILQEFFYG